MKGDARRTRRPMEVARQEMDELRSRPFVRMTNEEARVVVANALKRGWMKLPDSEMRRRDREWNNSIDDHGPNGRAEIGG